MDESEIQELFKRLELKIDAGFTEILDRIDAIERRRGPSPKTKEQLVRTIRDFYGYRCPCCENVDILDNRGSPLATAEYDHWFSKSKNHPHQMWIVCKACNGQLETDEGFKRRSETRFKSFQERRMQQNHPLL